MSSPTTRIRLFVAAYPPAPLAERLVERTRGLALPPGRLTAPEQVHLTLQFIGETDARQVEEVGESVQRSAAGIAPFPLTLGPIVALPKPSAPRLVAVTTDAPPPLREIVRRLAHRLARKPRKDAADRFTPHLTLERFTGSPGRVELPRDALLDEAFAVDEIRLMRSVLLPTGARHDVVARFELEQ